MSSGNAKKPVFNGPICLPEKGDLCYHVTLNPANSQAKPSTSVGGDGQSQPIPTRERVAYNGRNAIVYKYKRGTVRYVKQRGRFIRL